MPTKESHTPGTVSWFDLMTNDLEETRRFYGGLFDWTFDIGPQEMNFYSMCNVGGRPAAGMGQIPPGAQFPPSWTVYFSVTSVDETATKVGEAGGSVIMPAMDVPNAGRMAVCADPTGAVFGIWQPGGHTGAGITDDPGAMTWCEVNTRDAQKAREFYAQVFGLEVHKMDGMDYWTLHQGEETAAGVLQMTDEWPAEIPPHWMPYFAVGDTDVAADKVKELGGSVKVEPFDTPFGRIAVIADPGGAFLSLIALNPNRPQ